MKLGFSSLPRLNFFSWFVTIAASFWDFESPSFGEVFLVFLYTKNSCWLQFFTRKEFAHSFQFCCVQIRQEFKMFVLQRLKSVSSALGLLILSTLNIANCVLSFKMQILKLLFLDAAPVCHNNCQCVCLTRNPKQGGSAMSVRTLSSDPAHLQFSLNCLPNEEEIKKLTYQHIVQQTTKRIKQSTLEGLWDLWLPKYDYQKRRQSKSKS